VATARRGGGLRPLEGRVALVTGANRGIGRAIAEGLAGLGAHVLVGGRDLDAASRTAGELVDAGLTAEALRLDITDDASVSSAAAQIRDRHGRLDVLVNNAAIKLEHHPSPPSALPLAALSETLSTNVVGTVRVVQAMLPLLLASDRPRIVNLSSGLGSLTYNTTAGSRYQERPLLSYSTSKAALNMVTVVLANELAGTALRINAVDPGPVNTPMTRGQARRRPDDGARPVIDAILIENDGPTGCFFDERGQIPW
jgi:NAD(P)-dependent dehydrogenase (short-subunit alcohol dehydrogenase family)